MIRGRDNSRELGYAGALTACTSPPLIQGVPEKNPPFAVAPEKNPHLLGIWLKVVSVLHFCVQARYFPPPYWRKPNGFFFSGTHRISAKTQHPVCPRKKKPIFGVFFSGTDRPQIATFGFFFFRDTLYSIKYEPEQSELSAFSFGPLCKKRGTL